jgi:hypothetical protein
MKRLLIASAVVTIALITVAAAWSARGGAPAGAAPAAAHLHPSVANHPPMPPATDLAGLLANARFATARFATSLSRAKARGYRTIVTRHIPDMGWHFMNPKITEFDVTKPPILVYVKRGSRWQLVAFEWVFTEKPATDPLPGAQYGSFAAACHYVDGTFHPAAGEAECHRRSPESGAKFGFWHPDLVTLHVWLWYPNPDGIYAGMNPLIRPFN